MRLAKAVLTSTHNLCFVQKYENYQSFLSENFQFVEVKVSLHLNRCVFVMSPSKIIHLCTSQNQLIKCANTA